MPLELRKDSKWWYGRFKSNSKRLCINLGVKVKGTPPDSLLEEGDTAFERSKAQAHAKLEQLMEEAHSKTVPEQHLAKLYELKSGEPVGSIPFDEMAEAWDKIPVKRSRADRYVQHGHAIIAAFIEYLAEEYPKARAMADVTPRMARDFMQEEAAKGLAGRTWNSKLILLRSVFRGLARDAGIVSNPFVGIPTKDEDTVHRQPFDEKQLRAILDAADDFMRPIAVTGMCTAMRLGDCCLLKWESIDLAQKFVVVKTSKTGETAEIPLFPMLRSVITAQKKTKSPYVFSEQAAQFLRYRHQLSRRFQDLLKAAGIETHAKRKNSNRNASIMGFHSFRTTWITLALSAGVPMELVRRVTGHSTVNVVLKYYFRPGRKEFQEVLQQAMPRLLTDGPASPGASEETKAMTMENVLTMVKKMNARDWRSIRKEILATTHRGGTGTRRQNK